ncbi:MAG: CHAT domain-containing protein [Candidatus Helarchaeota archaeon]
MEQKKSIKVGNTNVCIYYGDITTLKTDVIVNSDDIKLTMDGGVAEAILNKAGPKIKEEAQKILNTRRVRLGDVVVTNAYNLAPVKKVFNAITFDAEKGDVVTPFGVGMATYYCLKKTDELGFESISFPAMGTGRGQLDAEAVSKSMIQKVFDYLNTSTNIKLVVFSLYNYGAWNKFFENFMFEAAKLKIKHSIPIRLSILRKGEVNYIDLTTNDTISVIQENDVSNKQLKLFSVALEEFIIKGKSKSFSTLQDLGFSIYNFLLRKVSNRLSRLASENLFLKLDDDLLSIPWELCYDGNEFFGIKYNMGRQVVVSPKFYIQSSKSRPIKYPLKVLLIADPTETLKGALQECDKIYNELSQVDGIELTYKKGSEIEIDTLLLDLAKNDLVHFAGHSFLNKQNPSESGWIIDLDSNEVLRASDMALMNAPPIVFANACESGAQNIEEKRKYQNEIFGIASGFLMGGIQNYIGTFTYVNDDSSTDFAVEFYKNLIKEDNTIGSSLRFARKFIIEKYGIEEILWASYMLYGDPRIKLSL